MLIVCNGAAKSGSTWLYNVVARLVKCDWPPRQYLTSSQKHPTIRPDALQQYLEHENFVGQNFISKTHYGSPGLRDLLLSHPHTRVLDLKRNLHDTIVSTYYDSCRRDGFDGTFDKFYWFEGRTVAEQLIRYHALWDSGHPQVLVTSFEDMKTNFAHEVRRIADFLGVDVDTDRITQLESETSIDSLRSQYKDSAQYADNDKPFFRKGVIGDWQNHFDDQMLRDMAMIERKGISRFDRVEVRNKALRKIYSWFPILSPYRKAADQKI